MKTVVALADDEDARHSLMQRLAADFRSLAPTRTALAAKELVSCTDNSTYQRVLGTRASLAGWVGARGAGLWDTHVSDAVAEATLGGILDLLRSWASECDERLPLAEPPVA